MDATRSDASSRELSAAIARAIMGDAMARERNGDAVLVARLELDTRSDDCAMRGGVTVGARLLCGGVGDVGSLLDCCHSGTRATRSFSTALRLGIGELGLLESPMSPNEPEATSDGSGFCTSGDGAKLSASLMNCGLAELRRRRRRFLALPGSAARERNRDRDRPIQFAVTDEAARNQQQYQQVPHHHSNVRIA